MAEIVSYFLVHLLLTEFVSTLDYSIMPAPRRSKEHDVEDFFNLSGTFYYSNNFWSAKFKGYSSRLQVETCNVLICLARQDQAFERCTMYVQCAGHCIYEKTLI